MLVQNGESDFFMGFSGSPIDRSAWFNKRGYSLYPICDVYLGCSIALCHGYFHHGKICAIFELHLYIFFRQTKTMERFAFPCVPQPKLSRQEKIVSAVNRKMKSDQRLLPLRLILSKSVWKGMMFGWPVTVLTYWSLHEITGVWLYDAICYAPTFFLASSGMACCDHKTEPWRSWSHEAVRKNQTA